MCAEFRHSKDVKFDIFKPARPHQEAQEASNDDDRVPCEVAGTFLARWDEQRVWRNAMCHGAWQGLQDDGSVGLRHFRRGKEGPESRENRRSVETPLSIRVAAVDLTADLVDILSAAGVCFPGTALPGAAIADYMRNNRDQCRLQDFTQRTRPLCHRPR